MTNKSYVADEYVWAPPLHTSYTDTYLSYRILHTSSTQSSARPATNERNTMKRADANAKWGAIHFEMQNMKNANRKVKGAIYVK